MPPWTRRPPAWIESDEGYAFRFLLPAESLDQSWPNLVSQTFSGKLPLSISPVAVVPVRRSNAAASKADRASRAPGKIGLTSQPDFAAINPLAANNANAREKVPCVCSAVV